MKRKRKKRAKRKLNPIIVTAKRGMKGEHLVLVGNWDEEPSEMQRDIVRHFFTEEAIHEIGCLILGALVAKDKQMALTVRDAIRQSNQLFYRDRERMLLEPALRYRLTNWDVLLHKNRGDIQRTVAELWKGIEQHCNNGKPLEPHQRKHLRLALGLPKMSCLRHDRKPVKHGEVSEIIDLAPTSNLKRGRSRSEPKSRKSLS
jgi:hypothetical protein